MEFICSGVNTAVCSYSLKLFEILTCCQTFVSIGQCNIATQCHLIETNFTTYSYWISLRCFANRFRTSWTQNFMWELSFESNCRNGRTNEWFTNLHRANKTINSLREIVDFLTQLKRLAAKIRNCDAATHSNTCANPFIHLWICHLLDVCVHHSRIQSHDQHMPRDKYITSRICIWSVKTLTSWIIIRVSCGGDGEDSHDANGTVYNMDCVHQAIHMQLTSNRPHRMHRSNTKKFIQWRKYARDLYEKLNYKLNCSGFRRIHVWRNMHTDGSWAAPAVTFIRQSSDTSSIHIFFQSTPCSSVSGQPTKL